MSNDYERAPRPYIRGLAKSTGLTQPWVGIVVDSCVGLEALFQMSKFD